ncbi:hypothetical protein [Deinococcus kurensis]|uniref:hypothetical protein n=1 Tax=Deinococcus kurensis TaxID=2662757 RepID=UPI0012D365F1|nr:hypothetical protein [Deinococcus kurensis]
MGNTYRNARARLGTSEAAVYTAPQGKVALVQTALAAALGAANSTVTVSWADASAGNVRTTLIQDGVVPVAGTLNVLTRVIVLEPGDALYASAGGGAVDLTVALLEQG